MQTRELVCGNGNLLKHGTMGEKWQMKRRTWFITFHLNWLFSILWMFENTTNKKKGEKPTSSEWGQRQKKICGKKNQLRTQKKNERKENMYVFVLEPEC